MKKYNGQKSNAAVLSHGLTYSTLRCDKKAALVDEITDT